MMNETDLTATPAGTFGAFLARAQREAGVSDNDVAQVLGFGHVRIYTLMRADVAKLPLSRIGPLARVLELGELELLREYVRCHFGRELLDVIERMLLRGLSDDERQLVESFRRLVREEPAAEVQMFEAHRALFVGVSKAVRS